MTADDTQAVIRAANSLAGNLERQIVELRAELDRLRAENDIFIRSNGGLTSELLAARARVEELTRALTAKDTVLIRARDQFRFYAKNHVIKNTPESLAKADVNAAMAVMCESALATEPPHG